MTPHQRAQSKIAELASTYVDGAVGDVADVVIADFLGWLEGDPEASAVVAMQYLKVILGSVVGLPKKAKSGRQMRRMYRGQSQSRADDDEPDYIRARREGGFHRYGVHE